MAQTQMPFSVIAVSPKNVCAHATDMRQLMLLLADAYGRAVIDFSLDFQAISTSVFQANSVFVPSFTQMRLAMSE